MNQAFNRDIEHYHSERITALVAHHRGPTFAPNHWSSRKVLLLDRAVDRAAAAVNALDPGAAPAESDPDDTHDSDDESDEEGGTDDAPAADAPTADAPAADDAPTADAPAATTPRRRRPPTATPTTIPAWGPPSPLPTPLPTRPRHRRRPPPPPRRRPIPTPPPPRRRRPPLPDDNDALTADAIDIGMAYDDYDDLQRRIDDRLKEVAAAIEVKEKKKVRQREEGSDAAAASTTAPAASITSAASSDDALDAVGLAELRRSAEFKMQWAAMQAERPGATDAITDAIAADTGAEECGTLDMYLHRLGLDDYGHRDILRPEDEDEWEFEDITDIWRACAGTRLLLEFESSPRRCACRGARRRRRASQHGCSCGRKTIWSFACVSGRCLNDITTSALTTSTSPLSTCIRAR